MAANAMAIADTSNWMSLQLLQDVRLVAAVRSVWKAAGLKVDSAAVTLL